MRQNPGIGQLKTLLLISNHGSTTTGKPAAALGVNPANVTCIVDRLLERKLITRTGDPDDRRVILLRTTSQGEDLVTELRQKRKERMSEIFGHLTENEAAIVAHALKIMVKAIEAQREEPSV